jgi:glycosyltransferase involved in cell wall biosynthesis
MRILHVINALDVGGAETLVAGLCATAQQSGDQVELYVLRSGGPLETDVAKAGIPIHSGGPGSVYSPLHVLRLAPFIKSGKFDVIHVHLYPAQLWVCLAGVVAGRRTPVVTTEHCAWNRRRTPLFRWADRWMYRQFTAIAAISEASRSALAGHLGDEMPTLSLVPNGIDAARFEFRLPRPGESRSTPLTLLSIGSLTRTKDPATVIRAMAQIEGATLMLAGDGPLRAELETMASNLGARSRVAFLGMRRDIPQLIASADLYIQASLDEGFCLAVVEAMCGGLPCIVSGNPGLRETVGEAGLYFEPGNANELASAIRALSNDPDRRAEMTCRGLERARPFSLQSCYKGYADLYARAVQWASRGVED